MQHQKISVKFTKKVHNPHVFGLPRPLPKEKHLYLWPILQYFLTWLSQKQSIPQITISQNLNVQILQLYLQNNRQQKIDWSSRNVLITPYSLHLYHIVIHRLLLQSSNTGHTLIYSSQMARNGQSHWLVPIWLRNSLKIVLIIHSRKETPKVEEERHHY